MRIAKDCSAELCWSQQTWGRGDKRDSITPESSPMDGRAGLLAVPPLRRSVIHSLSCVADVEADCLQNRSKPDELWASQHTRRNGWTQTYDDDIRPAAFVPKKRS